LKLTKKDLAIRFQALQLLVLSSSLAFPLFVSNNYSVNDYNSYQMLFRITYLASSVSGLLLPNLWASGDLELVLKKRSWLKNVAFVIRDRLLVVTLVLLSIPTLFMFDFFPKYKYTVPAFEELILWTIISLSQYYSAKFYYTCLANQRLNILMLCAAIPLFIVTLLIILGQTFTLSPVELLFLAQLLQIICFTRFMGIRDIKATNGKQG
jgi:hypothetical protein